MKIINNRGFLIVNARDNWKLSESTDCIEDAFCFVNPTEISKEKYKQYRKEIRNVGKETC